MRKDEFYKNLPEDIEDLLSKTHPLKDQANQYEKIPRRGSGKRPTRDYRESYEEDYIPEEEYYEPEPLQDQRATRNLQEPSERKQRNYNIDFEENPYENKNEPEKFQGQKERNNIMERYFKEKDNPEWLDEDYDDDDENDSFFSIWGILRILTILMAMGIIALLVYKNNALAKKYENAVFEGAKYKQEAEDLSTQVKALQSALNGDIMDDDSLIELPSIESPVEPATTEIQSMETTTQTASLSTEENSLSTASEKTYTVKSGDTLSSIARKEMGSEKHFKAIQDANNLPNANDLKVGMKLKIPAVD